MARLINTLLASLLLCCIALASYGNEPIRFSTVMGYGQVPLNVVQAGMPGRPGILFVHGFAQSQLSFKPQLLSGLADKYHLVAFDLRGHGASAKPWRKEDYTDSNIWARDIAAVIDATQLQKPFIVAWSYGGYVAMDYIRHYGLARITGINFVGTTAGLVKPDRSPPTEQTRRSIARVMELSRRSRSLNSSENISSSLDSLENLTTSAMSDKERQTVFAMQIMMPAYVRVAMSDRRYDNVDLLEKLQIPILLTRGSNDFFMPGAATRKLLDKLPNARLSVYPGSAHLPFYDQADRFNRELDNFIDKAHNNRRPELAAP